MPSVRPLLRLALATVLGLGAMSLYASPSKFLLQESNPARTAATWTTTQSGQSSWPGAPSASAVTQSEDHFSRMYLAAFLRGADLGGMNYWRNQIDNEGQSYQRVGGTIFSLSVVTAIYPATMSDQAFVEAIYQNVFGRASDAEGLNYWMNELATLRATYTAQGSANAGYEARGQLVMNMINAGLGTPVGTPGKAYIDHRYEAALYAIERQRVFEREIPPATLRSISDTVNADPSTLQPAKTAIDNALNILPPPVPVTSHPRLWITSNDLPQLRAKAVASNMLWQHGLSQAAARAVADMDQGRIATDCGDIGYSEYPTESYAAFFAFLSLVAPEAQRTDYAQRGRQLLLRIMTEADKGPATVANYVCDGNTQYPPFRHPDFATEDRDRARYHGESFGLAVDWLYPNLSASDRATIRRVFLRWSQDIITRGYHHPEPVGLLNDPQLYADRDQRRFAANNYYAAHMRNLGLMAMALDESDDPGSQLRAYLANATGAYFYIFKELVRSESSGGLLPEGFEYSPQTASYATQFLLALNTAGLGGDDAHALSTQTFWIDFVTAYLHSLSPATVVRDAARGAEYEPAAYGDAQDYQLPDFISSMAPLGIHAQHTGSMPERLNATRWIATHTPAGGEALLTARMSNPSYLRESLLYFMLLDPSTPPVDPRPALATTHIAQGTQRILSRTGWDTQARWFTFALPWNSIDHQNAEGNSFAFYRSGEWLTKTTLGYADIAESIASTEYANGMCIENSPPQHDDWRSDLWRRGSQWNLVGDGDPRLLASSESASYLYALGDATTLYNSAREQSSDVSHSSRAIVWLKPDSIIVYDRAETLTANRFKRFWLQLPAPASINGQRASSPTPRGQVLHITSLLPDSAQLRSVTGDDFDPAIANKIANHEPMHTRLSITAPGNPNSARFLTVLQGTDSGVPPATAQRVTSPDQAWQGALIEGILVLFPRMLNGSGEFTLSASGVRSLIITGLSPHSAYTLSKIGDTLTLSPGGTRTSDAGGVLFISAF